MVTKLDYRPVWGASAGSDRTPTKISDSKMNAGAYCIEQCQVVYGNDWHIGKSCRHIYANRRNGPYRSKSAPPYKMKYPSDVNRERVIKQVHELFADTFY